MIEEVEKQVAESKNRNKKKSENYENKTKNSQNKIGVKRLVDKMKMSTFKSVWKRSTNKDLSGSTGMLL